jgi:hypothetical protein
MTDVTRGSTVVFITTFKDNTGTIVNPVSANLYLKYRASNVLTTTTVALTQSGNTWTASWDSSVADGGRADWHIRSAGTNKAAHGRLAQSQDQPGESVNGGADHHHRRHAGDELRPHHARRGDGRARSAGGGQFHLARTLDHAGLENRRRLLQSRVCVETVKDEFWPQRDPWPWVIPGGLRPLQLTRWPIVSVASVIEDGTTLTVNTDFRIDTDKGQLIRLDSNGYPTRWPALAIAVQYSAGYATIPAPVVDAVIRMIVGRWYRKGRDPAIKSESADGTWSASYWFTAGPDSSTGHLTPDVEGLLDAYRVPVVAG